MSDLRQAAQQALEALIPLANAASPNERECLTDEDHERAAEALEALRAALAEHDRLAGIEAIEKDAGIHVSQQAEPEQEPVAWKLVPVEPTNEMLKAMDECSTEGYDERLLAGHAASVYMAAVDVAPLYTAPTPRKPLTDDEIVDIWAGVSMGYDDQINIIELGRAIERAHGIGEQHA